MHADRNQAKDGPELVSEPCTTARPHRWKKKGARGGGRAPGDRAFASSASAGTHDQAAGNGAADCGHQGASRARLSERGGGVSETREVTRLSKEEMVGQCGVFWKLSPLPHF